MAGKSDEDPKKIDVLRIADSLAVSGDYIVKQEVAVMDAAIFSRPPDDHPVYAKIGRVASDWSHVEHLLDLLIWELTGGDERLVAASTAQMNGIYPRCMALLALLSACNMLTDELRKQILNLQGKCGQTGHLRNRIVHDAWYALKGSPEVGAFRAMAKDDLHVGVKDIPEDHFSFVLKEIGDRFNEAKALHEKVHGLHRARSRG